MKLKEIAALSGQSYSTVSKVLYGQSHRFKSETVNCINYYKTFGQLIDKELRNGTFEKACDALLSKGTRSHSRRIEDILDLANLIVILKEDPQKEYGTALYGKYTAVDIFLDADFPELCNAAVKLIRGKEVRLKLMRLRDLSRQYRKKLGTLRGVKRGS